MERDTAQDPVAARHRFVELFSSLLVEAGLQRMPSRVFACVLASDAGRLTAAELAEELDVSAAAISSAVRTLVQMQMLDRGRERGARRDHYALRDDLWYELYAGRIGLMRRWEQTTAESAALLDGAAARRVEETRAFFAFLQEEMPAVLERWRERRAAFTP